MAYLERAHAFEVSGARAVPGPWATTLVGLPTPVDFSPLERTVIALARRDRAASFATPGRLARMLSGLFGLGRQSTLADPRLESLRRAAFQAWRTGAVPTAEAERMIAAGFTPAHVEALVQRIAAQRG